MRTTPAISSLAKRVAVGAMGNPSAQSFATDRSPSNEP
jgi:hypothetical protein